jgi:EAL domain-containing protein (putative c-di-GMP-specific phosphodiesterase class I)
MTTSIGMACCVGRDCVAEDVFREVAKATATAERQGGRRCILSDSSSRDEARARFDLEIDLRQAIDHAELRLDYQPTVDLATGRATGAEALIRWDHPRRGAIAPLDFIPVAEENELIVPIGSWVLGHACAQLHAWQQALGPLAPASLSVNVSGRQLARGDLAQVVSDLLDVHELDPANLCLEITESVLMDNAPGTIDALGDLRDLGVRLSVDDFGTGYSSLLYLRDFPVHELKIDRLFVAGLGRNRDDTAIVKGVIALAHGLNLTVVAEGVETRDQAESLRHLGSDVGQGYFWSRPAGADEIAELLRSSDGAPDGPAVEHRPADARRPVIDVRSVGGRISAGATTDLTNVSIHAAGRTPTLQRVLLIDDARPERELLGLWLHESARFEVIGEAGDGAEGVLLAAELEPDLVVLDMSMPGIDGIRALREIRAVSPRSAVVILSGFMSPGLMTATLGLGASACLDKGIGPARLVEELLGAVESVGATAP